MAAARFVVAVLLLAALGLGAWQISRWAPEPGGGDEHVVYVVGPRGDMAHGIAALDDATALSALQTVAAAQDFTVQTESLSGFGSGCAGVYVVAIAGIAETASGGWNYYVRDAPGAAWQWGDVGAACKNLAAGQEVEWCWVEGDVCARHHA